MPPDPPPLPAPAIRNLVGGRSFDLAHEYLPHVTHRRRAGRTLEARVRGTAAKPYAVSIRFDSNGHLASADCACPVGSGACKHVAAVLLAYLADPDSFTPADELDKRLNRLDKPQLIAQAKGWALESLTNMLDEFE